MGDILKMKSQGGIMCAMQCKKWVIFIFGALDLIERRGWIYCKFGLQKSYLYIFLRYNLQVLFQYIFLLF